MSKLVAYVLSGRNAGAELFLEPGSYTFGSSSKAYFTFDDPTIKELHLELELLSNQDGDEGENKIFITPLQGKVKVNSKAISERVEINSGDLISFAFNEIMLAPEGSDLNNLIAQAEEIKSQEYQERLDSALEQAKASLQQELQAQFDDKLVEATKQAQEQARLELTRDKDASADRGLSPANEGDSELIYHDKKVSLVLWTATLIGGLLLAILIYLLVFGSTANTPDHNEQVVKEYLQTNYVEQIHLSRDQGYLKVSGVVSSDEVKDKVLANLPELDEVLVVNLKSYQTILEDVKRAFELRGAVVRVDRTTDNHIHVFGYIQDALVEANLIASVRDILSNDALLNFTALANDGKVVKPSQGAVINSGFVLEPHFMYERSLRPILQRLTSKHELKLNYLYAPFDIAYLSDSKMESNPKYIALAEELDTLINGPVSLMDSPSMSYKYSLLKQRLASGKGLVYGENDRIAKHLSDTALGADQSALLDYYQQALDKASPYQKRIQEQSLASIYQSQANGLSTARPGVGLSSLFGEKNKNNNVDTGKIHQDYRGDSSYGSAANSQFLLSDILSKINDPNGNNTMPLASEAKGAKAQESTHDNIIKSQDYGVNEEDTNLGKAYEGATSLEIEDNLALDVMGVTMKPLRFISMRDGSKIFEGGMTPNGYVVKKIEVSHLILVDSSGKERLYELK